MFPGLSALRTQLAEFGECTSHIVLSDFPGLHMDVSELFPHLPRKGSGGGAADLSLIFQGMPSSNHAASMPKFWTCLGLESHGASIQTPMTLQEHPADSA